MLYSKPELVILAVQIAQEFQLDPALICAHIDVRSKWDSGLTLPTSVYYLAPYRSPEESEHRSLVWGLMGIQGEFARTEGYQESLAALLVPDKHLTVGCSILARLMQRKLDSVEGAVAGLLAWNREQNRQLAAQTLLKLEAYRELIARIPQMPPTFSDAISVAAPVLSSIDD